MHLADEKTFARRLEATPLAAVLPLLRQALPQAEWFIVGGAVRDLLLGRETGDYDLVVRHVRLEEVERALSALGSVDVVGKRFGVVKFAPRGWGAEPIDIAWPRTERAGMSGGYRDFAVQADPALPIESDLGRRDFTVNAVAYDIAVGTFIDPHAGRKDMEARLLRAVGRPEERFREDHSRMLRLIRFSCQLGFEIDRPTWDAIVALAPRLDDTLENGERVVPHETMARELVKALAADPTRAVELFERCGILFLLFPELRPLASCMQPVEYHSEGDVWTHTKLAVAFLQSPAFDRLFPGERPTAETALAALFHDSAKPETAVVYPDGTTTYYGHPERGEEKFRSAADRLRLANAGIDVVRVAWMIRMHLFPHTVVLDEVRRTTLVKHFFRDRAAGRQLLHLALADASATLRPDGTTDLSHLDRLIGVLDRLEKELAVDTGRPMRLITGEDIMELAGIAPGPEVGRILEEIEEAHLSGKISTPEEAKTFLKNFHS